MGILGSNDTQYTYKDRHYLMPSNWTFGAPVRGRDLSKTHTKQSMAKNFSQRAHRGHFRSCVVKFAKLDPVLSEKSRAPWNSRGFLPV